MLTYAAFNEALRLYKHDVYLHDVKVCEGRQDLHMRTSAYVGIRGARAPPFGHACAGPKKNKTLLFGPFSGPFLPFSAVCALFLPLSAFPCLFRALCASRSMPCVPARARREKKKRGRRAEKAVGTALAAVHPRFRRLTYADVC
jgi:hypothetical protein